MRACDFIYRLEYKSMKILKVVIKTLFYFMFILIFYDSRGGLIRRCGVTYKSVNEWTNPDPSSTVKNVDLYTCRTLHKRMKMVMFLS